MHGTYSQFVATARTATALFLVRQTRPSLLSQRLIIFRNDLVQSKLLAVRKVIIFALMVRFSGYLFGYFWPIGAVLAQGSSQLFELFVVPGSR